MHAKSHSTHVRWTLVTMLFLLGAATYLDRINLSIAGNALIGEYHLSNLQLGWILSAFLVGYGLFQTPCGRIADRCGPRKALLGAACWWTVFTLLSTAVPRNTSAALWLLILIRFLLGAGEAILYPAATLFLSRWIPATERGRANGLIFAGVGVGAGVTPPFITYCMMHWGWRFSFWLCGAIGLALGLAWYGMARDYPGEHPAVSAEEAAWIRAGVMQQEARSNRSANQNAHTDFVGWRQIAASRNLWLITAAYFGFGYVAWLFFSWFYLYLADARGAGAGERAFYAMLPFIAMVAGSLGGGVLSDWLTGRHGARVGRCLTASAALALAALLLVAGAKMENTGAASLVLSGGAGVLYMAQSSYWAVSADLGGRSSGLVSGMMNMGAQAGGALTASLTPWIALRYGWEMSFMVAAAIAIAGSLLWLLVGQVEPLHPLAVRCASKRYKAPPQYRVPAGVRGKVSGRLSHGTGAV